MEQRYQAVLAVIRDGVPVVEVAARCSPASTGHSRFHGGTPGHDQSPETRSMRSPTRPSVRAWSRSGVEAVWWRVLRAGLRRRKRCSASGSAGVAPALRGDRGLHETDCATVRAGRQRPSAGRVPLLGPPGRRVGCCAPCPTTREDEPPLRRGHAPFAVD